MAPQALLSGCWFYTPLRISIGTKTVGGFRLPTALLITLQFSLLILYLYWQCNHTTSCIHSYSIDIGPLYLRYKRKQYFLVLGQPRHIQKTQGGTTGNMMKTLYPQLLLKLLPSQPEASWAMLMPRCIRFWALCPATWQQDLDVRYRWCVEPLRVHMHHSNSFPTLKGDDFGKLHEPPFFDAKFLAWLWHPVFWCFWMLLGELSWLPYQRISRVAHRVAMELNCLTLHLSIHSIEFLFRSIQLLLFFVAAHTPTSFIQNCAQFFAAHAIFEFSQSSATRSGLCIWNIWSTVSLWNIWQKSMFITRIENGPFRMYSVSSLSLSQPEAVNVFWSEPHRDPQRRSELLGILKKLLSVQNSHWTSANFFVLLCFASNCANCLFSVVKKSSQIVSNLYTRNVSSMISLTWGSWPSWNQKILSSSLCELLLRLLRCHSRAGCSRAHTLPNLWLWMLHQVFKL